VPTNFTLRFHCKSPETKICPYLTVVVFCGSTVQLPEWCSSVAWEEPWCCNAAKENISQETCSLEM